MPNIKVSDEVYNRLKELAEGGFRTLGGQIDYLMSRDNTPLPKNTDTSDLFNEPVVKKSVGATPVEAVCCANDLQPCRHWSWDGNQLGYVNSLSGRFMEVTG